MLPVKPVRIEKRNHAINTVGNVRKQTVTSHTKAANI